MKNMRVQQEAKKQDALKSALYAGSPLEGYVLVFWRTFSTC